MILLPRHFSLIRVDDILKKGINRCSIVQSSSLLAHLDNDYECRLKKCGVRCRIQH